MEFLSKDSIVEVRRNKQGFHGAWYQAKILTSSPDPTRRIWVEYKSGSNQLLQERVNISFIRPLPPPPAADQTYKPHDAVDALCGNGWWKGVVRKVEVFEKEKRYIVLLENPFQELGFSSSDLRLHMDWTHGTWLPPPKQEIINIKEDTEGTLSNHTNKFKKAPSVLLIKSTEQVIDTTLTECSTGDSGANLPLNNEKNASPNQQELGQDNKKEKFSKKRGREMNAQVIRQKVAAAADQEKEEEQSARISLNGSSTPDNHGEKQSSVKKSRENPFEQSVSRSTTSTSKKQNMLAPETVETVPNNSNKFRTAKCSTFDKNGDGMEEFSEKRGRELKAQVPAAAEDKTNEDSAEVINGGNFQNFNQSSAVNVKAESEPVRDENLPFVKSSYMWEQFDSQEVFRTLPQTPHFSYLSGCHEETREGLAIGHMLTFASMVEKVSKLQIEDPTRLFVSCLEALDILKKFGFDVKAVVDRVNDLLSLKTRQEQFHDQSKRYQSLAVECDEKKAKLEEENTAIDQMMGELEARQAANVSQIVKEDSTKDFLQFRASTIEDFMLDMKQTFKVKSAAPWQRLI